MIIRGVVTTLGLLILAGGALALDEATRDGQAAEVAEQWVRAIRSFEKALAAKPDDPLRKRRLDIARKRGTRLWAAEVEACVDGKSWRRAAEAVAVFRLVNPTSKRIDRFVKKIENSGTTIPSTPPDLGPARDLFPARSYEGRAARMARFGRVRVRANDMIERMLSFLVRSQEEDGHWEVEKHGGIQWYAVGIDALGMLALLAEGPGGLEGARGRAMRRTADRIVKAQAEDGCFGGRKDPHFIYVHAVATRALLEYSHISGREGSFRDPLEKATAFLIRAQSEKGGWRYGMAPSDSDNSATYWCVAALEKLKALRFAVSDEVLQRAGAFAAGATDPKTGRGGYVAAGTGSARLSNLLEKFPSDRTESMTAAVVLIRLMAGGDPELLESNSLRLMTECRADPVIPDMYYWHLGAEAFVRMTGTVPADWYQSCVNSVERHLRAEGSVAAAGPWGKSGGRIYSTAVCALALMAPFADYRHLPETKRTENSVTFLVRPGGGATGIYLDAGEELMVLPAGRVKYHPTDQPTGPAGAKKAPKGRERLSRSGPYGCLLAWTGPEGKPVALKKKMKFRARECGQLHLAGNAEHCGRAGGAFLVTLIWPEK